MTTIDNEFIGVTSTVYTINMNSSVSAMKTLLKIEIVGLFLKNYTFEVLKLFQCLFKVKFIFKSLLFKIVETSV